MNAIELHHISHDFGDFAINNVTMSLPSGCIMGLVGENGAGKTTLIRLMLGALIKQSGEAFVLGHSTEEKDFYRIRDDVGVVLDEACLPTQLTVEQLEKVMRNTYSGWDTSCYNKFMIRFHLPNKKKIQKFSRGMKMKLAMACALSHNAKLLVLDEPTGGLDPLVRDEILTLLSEFTRDQGHSILFSSHITTDLEKICDYIAFMHQGTLILYEEKDRLPEKYGMAVCTKQEFDAIPEEAICGIEKTKYGVRALVRREKVSKAIPIESVNLETLMLFMMKGEAKQ